MRAAKLRFRHCSGSAAITLAAVCAIFTPAFVQHSAGQDTAQVKTGKVPIVGASRAQAAFLTNYRCAPSSTGRPLPFSHISGPCRMVGLI
jgi:hypothetical protein